MNTNFHTVSRMRENCTYGSMRGRAFPTGRPALLYTLGPSTLSSIKGSRERGPKMRIEGRMLVSLLLALPCIVFARRLPPEVEHAMGYGAEAKICLKVCDDMGTPVTNASVCAVFDMLPKPHSVYGKTDANGVCVVKGKTNGNKVRFLVGKEGYYGSQREFSYVPMHAEHDVKDGKWQPYGADEVIALRKMRSPQQMTKTDKWINVPQTNTWIGVDLLKGDFIKPFGAGDNADVEVLVEWDGRPPWESVYCRADMRFVGQFSGGYYVDNVCDSKQPYPYMADKASCFAEREIRIVNRNGSRQKLSSTRVPFRQVSSLVIRTRCVADENGEVTSASYGYINDFDVGPSKGFAAVRISYVLNPTPNDTNLEDIEIAKRSRHFIRHCEPPPSAKKERESLWPF